MSVPTFASEVPRLGVSQAMAFLPAGAETAELDVTIEIDGQQRTRRVTLTTTALPRRGGRRWWWSCPRCGKRARHLYPTFGLVCRACAGLKYRSQYCHDKHEDFGFH